MVLVITSAGISTIVVPGHGAFKFLSEELSNDNLNPVGIQVVLCLVTRTGTSTTLLSSVTRSLLSRWYDIVIFLQTL
jgi:hypothetical protein